MAFLETWVGTITFHKRITEGNVCIVFISCCFHYDYEDHKCSHVMCRNTLVYIVESNSFFQVRCGVAQWL